MFVCLQQNKDHLYQVKEKVSEKISLSDAEKQEWENVRKRVETLCQRAYDLDVRLYADGEETWMQTAADELMEEMMRKYNKEKVLIYNTLQCYRWDRLQYLKDLHEKAKKEGLLIEEKEDKKYFYRDIEAGPWFDCLD